MEALKINNMTREHIKLIEDIIKDHELRLAALEKETGESDRQKNEIDIPHLKALRMQSGLTLREVESKTGISNAYLSQLENGKIKKPSHDVVMKLQNVYNLRPTGESDEEAFEKWFKTEDYQRAINLYLQDNYTLATAMKAAWLASRKSKK